MNPYYYIRNGQGDVIGLFDANGTIVARYTYDSWGNLLQITDDSGNDKTNDTTFVGHKNPLRYRGYYYDSETKLYYLQSRYYNPEWGRFINADGYVSTGQGLTGTNMFAYCLNNPIMLIDPTGYCSRCGNSFYSPASMPWSTWEQHLKQYPVNHSIYDEPVSNAKRDLSGCTFSESTGYVRGKEKLPFKGKQNSKGTLYDENGQAVTERWYGPDGRPLKDRDWTDHGNPSKHPVPHDHDWGIREDGKFGHLPAYPSPGLTIDDRPPGIVAFGYGSGSVGGGVHTFPIPSGGPYYFPMPCPSFGGAPVIVY